jgi:hypothetical protein
MTPEEREKLNNLCKRIEDERNPRVFNGLLQELNELLGETPGPVQGKMPIQIHGGLMPTHEAILRRCAYCRLGNDFRPMIMRAEGWCQCEGCGHNAMPLDLDFRCTCANCEVHASPAVPPLN